MKPIKTKDHKGTFFSVLHTTEKTQIATMTVAPGGPARTYPSGTGGDSGAYGLHDGDQVVYCIEGEGEIEIENERTPLSTSEVCVIPAHHKHKIYNTGSDNLFFLNVYAPPAY